MNYFIQIKFKEFQITSKSKEFKNASSLYIIRKLNIYY